MLVSGSVTITWFPLYTTARDEGLISGFQLCQEAGAMNYTGIVGNKGVHVYVYYIYICIY